MIRHGAAEGQHVRPFHDCKVHVLILNFKSEAASAACAVAVSRSTYKNLEVVLLDNTDVGTTRLREQAVLSNARIVETGGNLGYAGGNNVGIELAAREGADVILILNPDAIVAPDAIEQIVATFRADPTVGICGGLVFVGEPSVRASWLRPERGFTIEKDEVPASEDGIRDHVIDTGYVEGCALALRREMLVKIGMLRPEFFLYFEESELCLRARDAGWRVVNRLNAVIRTVPETSVRPTREYYMVRNAILISRVRRLHLGATVWRFARELIGTLWRFPDTTRSRRRGLLSRALIDGLTLRITAEPPRLSMDP